MRPPSLREYSRAEGRIRQSIELRCGGFPNHTYDGRDEDLAAIGAYHKEHGVPPSGFFARLWWRVRGEVQAMTLCSGIRADSGRCRAQAIRGAEWCVNHHPDYEGARRRRNSKGGKRGGRGRPQAELSDVKRRLSDLVEDVLEGRKDRGDAAVAGQLLNTWIRAVGVELKVREQEELVREVEELRQMVETQRDRSA